MQFRKTYLKPVSRTFSFETEEDFVITASVYGGPSDLSTEGLSITKGDIRNYRTSSDDYYDADGSGYRSNLWGD